MQTLSNLEKQQSPVFAQRQARRFSSGPARLFDELDHERNGLQTTPTRARTANQHPSPVHARSLTLSSRGDTSHVRLLTTTTGDESQSTSQHVQAVRRRGSMRTRASRGTSFIADSVTRLVVGPEPKPKVVSSATDAYQHRFDGLSADDANMEANNDIFTKDDEPDMSLFKRLRVALFVIAHNTINSLISSTREYPAHFLAHKVDQTMWSLVLNGQNRGSDMKYFSALRTFADVGLFGLYRGFTPFAVYNAAEVLFENVPALVYQLATGQPPSSSLVSVYDWVSYLILPTIFVPCNLAFSRMIQNDIGPGYETPIQAFQSVFSTMSISMDGFFGVPWWVVISRHLLASDMGTNWRYYLPSTHPLFESRDLIQVTMASRGIFPLMWGLVIHAPMPDVDPGLLLRSCLAELMYIVPGIGIGLVLCTPASIAWQFVRKQVVGKLFESSEHRLERKIEHAITHAAQLRGQMDITQFDNDELVAKIDGGALDPGMNEPKLDAKTLDEKREALFDRLAEVADCSVMGNIIEEEQYLVANRLDVEASISDFVRIPQIAVLYGMIEIEFEDEYGVDAGGLFREYMSLMSGSITYFGLFIEGPDNALLPVKQTTHSIDGAVKEYLFAVGRLMALAITQNSPLDVCLSRCLYKLLVGETIDAHDVARIDPQFVKNRVAVLMKEGGVQQIEEWLGSEITFVGTSIGSDIEEELVEGGSGIRVTEANKEYYIAKLVEHYLIGHCRAELAIIIEGFHDIIPQSIIQDFGIRAVELELFVAGIPRIDVDDWKAHCILSSNER